MSTLAQCLRALRARGVTHVREPDHVYVEPGDDGDVSPPVIDIDRAIVQAEARDDGEFYELVRDRVGDTIWMSPITEWSEPYWLAVPAPPPAWIPTVWDRLLTEEAP